ncbi:MAG TPA: cytochrome c biogenesis protein CcdA [Tepidiformaceae bacterium]|nr:cytochrome c biogenesis protein CcdA [Tepidiformaceae bacterium]
MTTRQMFGYPVNSRGFLYLLFALLLFIPIAAFALGPLHGDSFSLAGPGGPLLAFSAGVLSFVSPCVLPLVPVYITHLSGASVENGRIVANRRVTFMHALVFVVGFSLVFIALGTVAGLIGSHFLDDNQRDIGRYAGMILVVMGILLIPARGRRDPLRSAILLLFLTAVYVFLAKVASIEQDKTRLLELGIVLGVVWLRFAGYLDLPFLSRTFATNLGEHREIGYTKSALVGGAFALGWTPCIGPVLGSILTLAGVGSQSDPWRGTYLLLFYSIGLSIPFLITGLALSDVTPFLKRLSRYTPMIEVGSGLMIVSVGVLLVTGHLSGLSSYFGFASFNGGL